MRGRFFKRANLMAKNIFRAQKANFPVWKTGYPVFVDLVNSNLTSMLNISNFWQAKELSLRY